jgi:hypothetical protein
VTLPLELAVNLDAKEPSLLNRRNNLLVEVNWCRRSGAGTGKVDELALFRGEFHPPRTSPLAASLPGGFEVAASRLRVLTERKEVEVIGEADCNMACVVLELSV